MPIASPPVFTISVGGLEAGGTGKTPVTDYVLRLLRSAGRRPGLLTRGYRRTTRGLVLRGYGEPALPHAIGDEPAMLVNGGLDVPIGVCARRARAAAAVVQTFHCDTLVLDDAFSHRAMGRHLDIVVLRGEQPFGSGHLLPWGSLREPLSSLRRATLVWMHYRTERPEVSTPKWHGALCPNARMVVSAARPADVKDLDGGSVAVSQQTVVAAAGIARANEFFAAVAQRGFSVCAAKGFRDHHAFVLSDVEALLRLAKEHAAQAVIVTPKDAVKLKTLWPRGPDCTPLWIAGTEVVVVAGRDTLVESLGISGFTALTS